MLPATSGLGVRRDKAALSSGCRSHPAIHSSRKQPEQAAFCIAVGLPALPWFS